MVGGIPQDPALCPKDENVSSGNEKCLLAVDAEPAFNKTPSQRQPWVQPDDCRGGALESRAVRQILSTRTLASSQRGLGRGLTTDGGDEQKMSRQCAQTPADNE
jgi:hypothetical protein